jgi:hypothetical protein
MPRIIEYVTSDEHDALAQRVLELEKLVEYLKRGYRRGSAQKKPIVIQA